LALLGLNDATESGRRVTLVLTTIGVSAGICGVLAILRGRPIMGAALSILSIVMPTWYWYPVAIAPLVIAGALVLDRKALRRVEPT